jgi:preprotein translocase subunit SecG
MQLADYLDIAQIIVSIALVLAIVLQSKSAGLGGLTGSDTGGVFRARRGVEKTLFNLTIVLSVIFFLIAIVNVVTSR